MWLKRPDPEEFLEFVSIPQEMSRWNRLKIRLFLLLDPQSRKQVEKLQNAWSAYFQPEPDVMDSVMRVYGRLKRDETLILKGWKLSDTRPVLRKREFSLVHMLGATGVAAGVGALVLLIGPSGGPSTQTYQASISNGGLQHINMMSEPVLLRRQPELPLARIRRQERNTIQVHYVQPELLQSIEFETTGNR